MGGATTYTPPAGQPVVGLSPRGRGNRNRQLTHHPAFRSIPAWVGQPLTIQVHHVHHGVYPRVGGATIDCGRQAFFWQGLSPRGRGNHGDAARRGETLRSIPAWAGQPSLIGMRLTFERVYPRVGGATRGPDEAGRNPTRVYPRVGGATHHGRSVGILRVGLSPRGRGNLVHIYLSTTMLRSIPAWAGQPGTGGSSNPTSGVYPRVGGATKGFLDFDP